MVSDRTTPRRLGAPGGTRAVLGALLALALSCALAPSASDAAGVPPSESPPIKCSETETGWWPEPEGLYRSGACLIQGVGGLTIAPQVVAVGEPITASMASVGEAEKFQEAKWGWEGFVSEVGGGHVLSGCGEKSASCTVEASPNAAQGTWEVFSHAVSYGGIFAGTSYSSEYFIIEGAASTIAGAVVGPKQEGISGATVTVTGTESNGEAVNRRIVTGAGGAYSLVVQPGSYTVAPTGTPAGQPAGGEYKVIGCSGSERAGSCSLSVGADQKLEASFEYSPPHNQVSITLEPASVSTDGFEAVNATITDTNPEGKPVAGATIKIEPPVTYEERPRALVCDEAGSLAYPTRLSDGSILGAAFTRTTNSEGKIHLTVFIGTVAGDWLLEAGEPEASQSQWGHVELDVSEAGGRTELKPELPAELVAASNATLSNLHQSGMQDVLEWLGELKTSSDNVLAGVGFMPVWARDPAGLVNGGVVLFANAPAVRQALFDYLDGKTSTPPPESQAVVIDVSRMRQLLLGAYLAEQKIDTVGYRFPSLMEWEQGTVVAIGENLLHEHPHIPIPARGRPHAGFFEPRGSEALTYEYGPYPPAAGSPATRALFAKCVSSPTPAAETPETGRTTITAHSPVTLLATGAQGQVGATPNGKAVDTIPGTLVRYQQHHATELQLPSGAYQLSVTGTGAGKATLVFETETAHGIATEVFSFKTRKGEHGRLSLSPGRPPASMTFGGRRLHGMPGLALNVKGLPRARKLRHGASHTLQLTVTDQFGKPVTAVKLNVRGPSGANGLTAVPDSDGKLSIKLDPRTRGEISLRLSGPGYRPKTIRIQVT